MKIEIEFTDGFLVSQKDGSTESARAMVVRHQARKGGKWTKVNIIVDTEDVPTALEAAAAYLRREQG